MGMHPLGTYLCLAGSSVVVTVWCMQWRRVRPVLGIGCMGCDDGHPQGPGNLLVQ